MSEELLLRNRKVVDFFLKKGVLVSPNFLSQLESEQKLTEIYDVISKQPSEEILVLNNDVNKLLIDLAANQLKVEEAKTVKDGNKHFVRVISSYNEPSKKREVQDFVDYYNNRHKQIESLLRNRQELQNATSINKILGKKDKNSISIIGIVSDKHRTRNDNLMLTLEDPTGKIKAVVRKTKTQLYNAAKEVVLDEVVGIVGVCQEDIIFVNNIIWPGIPANNELKASKEEFYVAFLSDLHVGSAKFLPEDFNRFLKWVSCEIGNDAQKEIAKNVKYIFISGDLVDGCGIYPGQEKELLIPDIYEQYKECARLLSQIPQQIPLIICPGNHDATRLAEPQPALQKKIALPLQELPNAIIVSNPSLINIAATQDFPGFDVLMYHGASFDHFVREVDELRIKGGYNRGDLIMRFLLQRRHLAPTHTSTQYIPDTKKDPLVIENVPDFFISGHIHKSIVANYHNVTLVSGSCWQSKTSYQEKMGHNPEPSRVPVVNMQTRKVKIMKFG